MGNNNFLDINIIGESQAIRRQLEFIHKVAYCDKNILILGKTGIGKELTAKLIHKLSSRRYKPFVVINRGNIPEELFEAELFGFEQGSFTGAIKEKVVLLEVAYDGTVFLDEIGDLSPHHQAKILRTIEKREMRRIGKTALRKIYGRFIFATNKNLKEEVEKGRFRRDFYYRINIVTFHISSLREKKKIYPYW